MSYYLFQSAFFTIWAKTESQSSQVENRVLAVALDNKFMFLAQIEAAELGLVVHTLKQAGLVTLERV